MTKKGACCAASNMCLDGSPPFAGEALVDSQQQMAKHYLRGDFAGRLEGGLGGQGCRAGNQKAQHCPVLLRQPANKPAKWAVGRTSRLRAEACRCTSGCLPENPCAFMAV